MTLAELQRELDRRILQHMEECRDSSFGRFEYAFHFDCFVQEPKLTRDMVRAVCRSLTDRGYCFYMRGHLCEDGSLGGAGYGITDKGAEYLETLFSEEEKRA